VTPLSWWTVGYAVLAVLVVVAVRGPLVRRTGWRPAWTVVSLLALAAVLAVTLAPSRDFPRPLGVGSCLREAAGQVRNGSAFALGGAQAELNLVLLVPLGTALVLATRRVRVPLAVVLALPALVELTQTQVPGRLCSGNDYVVNVTGGLGGVALGVALVALTRAVGRLRA
jgi:VanZ family protein